MSRRERPSNASIKEREMLYRLIVRCVSVIADIAFVSARTLFWWAPYGTYPTCSQLRYDGYENAAAALSNIISSFPPTAPSSRLSHLVQLGLRTEGEGE